jgi:hypothetical protein
MKRRYKTTTQFDTTWYVEMEKRIQAAPLARRVRPGDAGSVYVIEFTSGMLKVGKSVDPTSRLAVHASRARVHGDDVRRSWVSDEHPGHSESERRLIAFCKANGKQISREYFGDLRFECARTLATRLATDARRRAYLDELIEAAGGDLSMTWQAAHDLAATEQQEGQVVFHSGVPNAGADDPSPQEPQTDWNAGMEQRIADGQAEVQAL